MTSLRRALLSGFFVWLIPFAVAFMIFAVREGNRPLFESVMAVTVGAATVALAIPYFRRVTAYQVWEGLGLGLLWLAISVAIDTPLMLLGGPMYMTVPAYVSDIGVTYLLIPVITVGMGAVGRLAARTAAGGPGTGDSPARDG